MIPVKCALNRVTDAAPLLHQLECGKVAPGTVKARNAALGSLDSQVGSVLDAYKGAEFYVDYEPGPEGWKLPEVRAWARQLGGRVPGALGFFGASFVDSLLAEEPEEAKAVAAAFAGIILPAYHGVADPEKHERVLRRRLERLEASGIPFGCAVCTTYHPSIGAPLAGTPVPPEHFAGGLAIVGASRSRFAMVWTPRP